MRGKTQMWHAINNGKHATSTTELMVRVFIFIAALAIALQIFTTPALAANDPGHDGLYILRTGDNVTGNFKIVGYINATIYYDTDSGAYYLNPSGTSNLNALTLNTPLAVAQGGTGATSATNARTNLLVAANGTCPAGTVVQNATASAIQCVAVGTGNGSVTSITQGTGLTFSSNPITTTGTISLNTTGVTAASYGSATQVATFTVDANGRLTLASNTAIQTGSTSQIGLLQLTDSTSSTSTTTAATPNSVKTAYDLANTVSTRETADNTTQASQIAALVTANNTILARESANNVTQAALINAKASPGTCASGQVVQNTTTGGVHCVTLPATIVDTNDTTQVIALSTRESANNVTQAAQIAALVTANNTILARESANNVTQAAQIAALVTANNTILAREAANNVTQAALINAKASPGTCAAGSVVQNTTTGGVQCITADTSATNELQTIAGDTGSTSASTITIAGGTDGIDTAVSGSTLTITFDGSELPANDIAESAVSFSTVCGSTSKLYVSGTGLACNSDLDTNDTVALLALTTKENANNNTQSNQITSLTNRVAADNTTQSAQINTKAAAANCGAGQVVQNTTSSGVQCVTPSGGVGGSGTPDYIPKFSASTTLTDSIISETSGIVVMGGNITMRIGGGSPAMIAGSNSAGPYVAAPLHIRGGTDAGGSGASLYLDGGGGIGNDDGDVLINTQESGGMLGVATTTPNSRISIGSAVGSGWASHIQMISSSGDDSRISMANDGLLFRNFNDTGGDIAFDFRNKNDASLLKISGDGNVSINSASVAYKFAVQGNAYFSSSVTTDSQFLGYASDTVSAPSFSWSTDTNNGMYRPAADNIGFTTSGAERMRINATGSVGIGASPTAKLLVENTLGENSFRVNDGSLDLSPFVIDNDGKVGVRTLTPRYELDVAGSILLTGGNRNITIDPVAGTGGNLLVTAGDSTGGANAGHLHLRAGGAVDATPGNIYIYSPEDPVNARSGAIILQHNGTQLMNEAYVGIATTTPRAPLEVNGSIRMSSSAAKSTCSSTVRGAIYIEQGATNVADKFYACMKNSTNAYNWVQVAIG